MPSTSRLKIAYLASNQSQKHLTVNDALRRLDAVVQLTALSATTSDEPVAPQEGDCYLLPASRTGQSWTGMSDSAVAYFRDGEWEELRPGAGWRAFVADMSEMLIFDGSTWRAVGRIGVNTSPDNVNRLAVKSDAVMFSHDDVSPGSGDMRLFINKSSAVGVASVIFQDAFSGRAEIGLIGSDDFSIRTSADGVSWSHALFADRASGFVGVGETAPASRLHVTQAADARLTINTLNSGSGGGFDIVNSADNQSWRVTGQAGLFKLRDHSAGLDKLVIHAGSGAHAILNNIGNFGVGVAAPIAKLDVDGPVRVKSYVKAALPSASAGAGQMIYVSDEAGGAVIAFSDGANWRRVTDRAVVS